MSSSKATNQRPPYQAESSVHRSPPIAYMDVHGDTLPRVAGNQKRPTFISLRKSSSSTRSETFDPEIQLSDGLDTPLTPPNEYELPIRTTALLDSPKLPSPKSTASRNIVPRKSTTPVKVGGSNEVTPIKRPRGRPPKQRVSLDPREVNSSPIQRVDDHLQVPSRRRASSATSPLRARTTRSKSPSYADQNTEAGEPTSSVAPSLQETQPSEEPWQYSFDAEVPSDEAPREPTTVVRPFLDEEKLIPYNKNIKNQREVNGAIHKVLRAKQKCSTEKTGWVYVFQKSSSSKHVKIGRTENEPAERRAQLERCFGPLIEVEDNHKDAFAYPRIVELLIFAELHNQRKTLPCPCWKCGKKHEEFVEVDTATALMSRNRWRKWMVTHQPFDDKRRLTKFWAWRVEKVKEELSDVNWDRWTKPCLWHRGEFWLECNMPGFAHHMSFTRKDMHFWVVGALIACLTFLRYRWFGVVLVYMALFAL